METAAETQKTEAQPGAEKTKRTPPPPRPRKGPLFGMATPSGDRRVAAISTRLLKQENIANADVDLALTNLSKKTGKDGAVKYPDAVNAEVRAALVAKLTEGGKAPV